MQSITVLALLALACTGASLAQDTPPATPDTTPIQRSDNTNQTSNRPGPFQIDRECFETLQGPTVMPQCRRSDPGASLERVTAWCSNPSADNRCSNDQMSAALDAIESKCRDSLANPVVVSDYRYWYTYPRQTALYCAQGSNGTYCSAQPPPANTTAERCSQCAQAKVNITLGWKPNRTSILPANSSDSVQQNAQKLAQECNFDVSNLGNNSTNNPSNNPSNGAPSAGTPTVSPATLGWTLFCGLAMAIWSTV